MSCRLYFYWAPSSRNCQRSIWMVSKLFLREDSENTTITNNAILIAQNWYEFMINSLSIGKREQFWGFSMNIGKWYDYNNSEIFQVTSEKILYLWRKETVSIIKSTFLFLIDFKCFICPLSPKTSKSPNPKPQNPKNFLIAFFILNFHPPKIL